MTRTTGSWGVRELPPGWTRRSLKELTTKIGSGATPRGGGGVYVSHGPALIRSQNIHDSWFQPEGLVRLTREHATGLRNVTVERGDVLINITGDSILRCCVVIDAVLPARVNQHVAILRTNEQMLPLILQKQLVLPAMKRYMLGHSAGGTRKAITKRHLENFLLTIPPLREQRQIAQLLGALDDKIESNRRLLKLSFELAAASICLAATDPSATHLPVAALARFVNGGAYTKLATGAGRMVVRIAELNSGPGGSTIHTERDVPDDQTARAGDLLMSWSGSLDIYRWTRDEAIINQHIFKVIPKDLPAWLVHDRLKAVMPIFQSIAKDKAPTMGHIQRGHLESTTVPMPPSEQIKRLDVQLGPLWDRVLLAEREIHALAALRDALAPELLSGRIRVPEAGEAVESALA